MIRNLTERTGYFCFLDHPDSSVPGDGDKIDDLNSDNNNVQEENPNATGKGCWHWARNRLKSIVEDDKKLTQARLARIALV